jgi:hypothetical protein
MNIDDSNFEGKDWLAAELEDTLDEDYELEISEPALSVELRRIYKRKHPPTLDRVTYFKAHTITHNSPRCCAGPRVQAQNRGCVGGRSRAFSVRENHHAFD